MFSFFSTSRSKPKKLKLRIGRAYRNREGGTAVISSRLEPLERLSLIGFDFVDTDGNVYYADGSCIKGHEHRHDLISQL